ncbi:MAG: hypothetical protein ACLQBQ_12590 [Smithella sp.]
MNVKGIVLITGKTGIIGVFGEERWNSFMANLVEKDKYFNKIIMSITPIPLDKFILFLDEMCIEFFNNDKMQYLTFGKLAAQYALSPDGPYKSYLLTKDIKQYIELVLPRLWSTYFDEGIGIAKFGNNVAHIKITGLQIKYLYFEYLIMGFFQKALKMFGKKSVAKRIRSLSSGDDDIYFQFELKDS